MRVLFVHQNFPGQFVHLIRRLVDEGGHDIVFITEPNENRMAGVRVLSYVPPQPREEASADVRDLEVAFARARIVQEMGNRLKDLGFTPDIVIGHHGWGELLNIRDVWPGVPLLGYFEYFYHQQGYDVGFDPEFPPPFTGNAGVRIKNTVNLLALSNPGQGQTPTLFQHGTYPPWARERIAVLPEGVDLRTCRPDPAARAAPLRVGDMVVEPGDTLVTFVARDIEPYRGAHTMIRALPALHARPGVKVVMVGGDGVSYGSRLAGSTWREHLLREVSGRIDPARTCFPGRVPYPLFLQLLQRSDAHVYLTFPFVLSWSLREALACGCAVVASDVEPVREFVTHGRTGLLVPFKNPDAVAAAVFRFQDQPALARRLRRAARRHAEQTLNMDAYLDAYQALVARTIAEARG